MYVCVCVCECIATCAVRPISLQFYEWNTCCHSRRYITRGLCRVYANFHTAAASLTSALDLCARLVALMRADVCKHITRATPGGGVTTKCQCDGQMHKCEKYQVAVALVRYVTSCREFKIRVGSGKEGKIVHPVMLVQTEHKTSPYVQFILSYSQCEQIFCLRQARCSRQGRAIGCSHVRCSLSICGMFVCTQRLLFFCVTTTTRAVLTRCALRT